MSLTSAPGTADGGADGRAPRPGAGRGGALQASASDLMTMARALADRGRPAPTDLASVDPAPVARRQSFSEWARASSASARPTTPVAAAQQKEQ